MPRLTVQELRNIQQPTIITESLSIGSIFTANNQLYICNTVKNSLMKFSLKDMNLQEQIHLPKDCSHKIISMTSIDGQLVLAMKKSCDLLHINTQFKLSFIQAHMDSINQVLTLSNTLISCSDDMTLRVWKLNNKRKLVPNPLKHILHGHKGKVFCVQKYGNFVVSASQDKRVIFWINSEIHCAKQFECEPINLCACIQSDQISVLHKNGEISIINMINVAKKKTCQITRAIKLTLPNQIGGQKNFGFVNEIDDSFIAFSLGTQIYFAEINLGQIVSQKKLLNNDATALSFICKGRMIFYAEKDQNLQMLRI